MEGPKGPLEVPTGPTEDQKGPTEDPWTHGGPMVGASGVRNESRRIAGDFRELLPCRIRELLPCLVLPPPSPTLLRPIFLEGAAGVRIESRSFIGASGVPGVWRSKGISECRSFVGASGHYRRFDQFSWLTGLRVGEAKNPGPGHEESSAIKLKARGSKPKFQDIIILNSSGEPQLIQALDYYKVKDLANKEASRWLPSLGKSTIYTAASLITLASLPRVKAGTYKVPLLLCSTVAIPQQGSVSRPVLHQHGAPSRVEP